MSSVPFCVLEKPHMVWGHDIRRDNLHFLENVDAELYYRAAHNIIGDGRADPDENEPSRHEDDEQDRKDVSTLSRLLWHHGMETLVMMLGAMMQAPSAAHAYFLKCKTEDAAAIADCLLREERPRYHRLNDVPFSLTNLFMGIHLCTGWEDRESFVEKSSRAFKDMLRNYATDEQRWEYNSIKHGLRASHGRFGIAVGIQEAPGVPARPEAMEMVGFSRDASFFDVARPLKNATKSISKVHFSIEKVSVSWSLEIVLGELQLLSVLLRNTIAAMRIAAGEKPSTVAFSRLVEADAFWDTYFSLYAGNIPHASMTDETDVREIKLPSDKDIFASYRNAPT